MQQRIQIPGIDHCNRFFLRSHPFVHQIAGNLQRSLSRSLTASCLKHIKFSVLNRKLHILHVSVMAFQSCADFIKLLKYFGHHFRHLRDRHRCTDTCHNVLALGIHQKLTHQLLLARSRISCECNAGAGLIGPVAERHLLYVYSGSPGIRDIIVTTVYVRTGVVPGTEHGFYRAHQLIFRIRREILADLCLVLGFKLRCKVL